jgi:hypothetical protein
MNHTLLKPVVEATSGRPLAGRVRAIWGVLREFAPYAAIELVLPGGTVLAILCWLYRRRRMASPNGSVTRLLRTITAESVIQRPAERHAA